MTQNRDAPAYQEYAASMMARTEYRVMSMPGRGLLLTLRHECWVNGELPADPAVLARVLGFPQEQIDGALSEVRAFFTFEAGMIRCPELDDYRLHLEERRQKQSKGGRAGAAKTNGVRSDSRTGSPTGKPRVPRESLVQNSQVQHSKTQRSNVSDLRDPWVSDYERASKGV